MKHITDYIENGRTFIICQDTHDRYWAFEDCFVKNGRLTKEFNGITGKMSNTLKETLERVQDQIRFDKYVAEGMERGAAMLQVFMEKYSTLEKPEPKECPVRGHREDGEGNY